jgi:catechol 2,3-dioxygenase-like lactoylglutathione lyase family enzyme
LSGLKLYFNPILENLIMAHLKDEHRKLIFLVFLLFTGFSTIYAESESGGENVVKNDDYEKVSQEKTEIFSSEILPVYYVKDVCKSVEFYRDILEFEFYSYHDYDTNESVKEWTKGSPAIYAELGIGSQRFALHLPRYPDSLVIGGTRLYIGVNDVRQYRSMLEEKGVEVGQIREYPWMTLFRVVDPDGHLLFFFTRPD